VVLICNFCLNIRHRCPAKTSLVRQHACNLSARQGNQSVAPPALASTPPGMPGTHPPNILVGGTSTGISPPILLRTFGYSRPILVALCSLSLKPFSFGYKTPPIRFSQAGGQSAHKTRPPNLELALTPLAARIL